MEPDLDPGAFEASEFVFALLSDGWVPSAAGLGLFDWSFLWFELSSEVVGFLFPARLALLGYVHSSPLRRQRSHAGHSPLHRSCCVQHEPK